MCPNLLALSQKWPTKATPQNNIITTQVKYIEICSHHKTTQVKVDLDVVGAEIRILGKTLMVPRKWKFENVEEYAPTLIPLNPCVKFKSSFNPRANSIIVERSEGSWMCILPKSCACAIKFIWATKDSETFTYSSKASPYRSIRSLSNMLSVFFHQIFLWEPS